MPMTPPAISLASDAAQPAELELERTAVAFAAMDAVAAETQLDSLSAQAIARWRLAEATAWQRVKFRARLIRAARRIPPSPTVAP